MRQDSEGEGELGMMNIGPQGQGASRPEQAKVRMFL